MCVDKELIFALFSVQQLSCFLLVIVLGLLCAFFLAVWLSDSFYHEFLKVLAWWNAERNLVIRWIWMVVRQNIKISEFSLKYSALLLGKTALKLKVSTWVLWRCFELHDAPTSQTFASPVNFLEPSWSVLDYLCKPPNYLWLQNI